MATEHTHQGPNSQTVAHNHNHGDYRHDHGSLKPFDRWQYRPGMDTAQRDAEMIRLQAVLLDHAGLVQVSPSRAYRLLGRINALRKANGFDPLSLRGRWAATS